MVEGCVEQAEEASLFEERGCAGVARARVALEVVGGARVQFAVEVGGCPYSLRALGPFVRDFRHTPYMLVMPRATRSSRIASRARKILFLTVPSGRFVTSAISS